MQEVVTKVLIAAIENFRLRSYYNQYAICEEKTTCYFKAIHVDATDIGYPNVVLIGDLTLELSKGLLDISQLYSMKFHSTSLLIKASADSIDFSVAIAVKDQSKGWWNLHESCFKDSLLAACEIKEQIVPLSYQEHGPLVYF